MCSISSTFSVKVAASIIVKQLQGKIVKQECEANEFIIPETAEVIE